MTRSREGLRGKDAFKAILRSSWAQGNGRRKANVNERKRRKRKRTKRGRGGIAGFEVAFGTETRSAVETDVGQLMERKSVDSSLKFLDFSASAVFLIANHRLIFGSQMFI